MTKIIKRIVIHYIGYFKTDKDGDVLPQQLSVSVVNSKVIRFRNCLHLLIQLKKGERILLDYLTEQMNVDNSFTNTVKLRQEFNIFIKSISAIESYSEGTIKNSLTKLKKLNLIQGRTRSDYFVNPEYFFNGNTAERKAQIIKYITEERADKNIKDLVKKLDKKAKAKKKKL